jgi:uncharacterized protein YyaL (SSP411 family)
MSEPKKPNRLAREKSPYLLQHADNPVDWYPWGEEAFAKAARENKPIFLSIGYSTCHWCHVMAHESFEDPEVGRLMNAVFVSIKVDREEHPEIDLLYMTVCQMVTGSGGWPLTIMMTPDRKPFFAGTYIPRETRFGRLGLMDLIPRIREIWATRKDEVLKTANQIIAALRKAAPPASGEDLGEDTLSLAYQQLRDRFDKEYGGFGSAPKFPTAHNLSFLLRYWKRTGDHEALDMVEKTLQAMRRGGVYDQVGFGFHRYSTDRRWLVPHFEKMLYDQALLAVAYIEAFQATGKEEYALTAREIYTYLLRDMTDDSGGFYSAEDADSEGEEGKFYLWTPGEIREALAPEEADFIMRAFNVIENGNFTDEAAGRKTGRNILYLTDPLPDIAAGSDLSLPELRQRLDSARRKLFDYREKRVHPHKDDKVLSDWNGLMIATLAKGARVLDEPAYADAAVRAADFIFNKMLDSEGRLLHRYRDGEAAIPGHLDDYTFLIHGLLELYETTFEVNYLEKALILNSYLLDHFWDGKNGGFYFTADDGEGLLVRQKEIYDGAIPSGNSIAMLNLLRLGRITANSSLEEKAAAIGRAFVDNVRQAPSAYIQLMIAVDFAVGPSYEVVIAGDRQAAETREMLQAIRSRFIPNKVVVWLPPGPESSEVKRLAPFTADHEMVQNGATAYVCTNYECQRPVTNTTEMLFLLGSG